MQATVERTADGIRVSTPRSHGRGRRLDVKIEARVPRRFDVALTYNYWPERRWHEAFERLGLAVERWSNRLHLYPLAIDWIFGRSLHFVARLGFR